MKLKKTRYAFLFSVLAISSVQAGPLYWGGGTTDITDGTPLPAFTLGSQASGNWDTVTKNWSADPTVTVYQAYTTATDVSLGLIGAGAVDPLSAAINLEADSNFTFTGRLYGGLWSSAGFNQAFLLSTAGGVATVTLGGTSAAFDFTNNSGGNTAVRGATFASNSSGTNAVLVAGSAQMVVRGGSRININSASSGYTGAVRVENGNLFIGNFGAASNANLSGATSFDVRSVDLGNGLLTQQGSATTSIPLLSLGYTSTLVSDAIGDTAPITLRGGQLSFLGIRNATTPTNEIADRLNIDAWGFFGLGGLSSGSAGSGLDAQLSFTNGLNRLGNRSMLLVGVNSTGTLAGSTSKVTFTGGSAAFGSALLPWMATSRSEFVKINADALEVIPSIAAATDLGSWASTYSAASDIRVGNGTAFAPTNTIGSTTVNSLGLFPSGTTALAQAAGTTLTIQSGGLAYKAGGGVTISGGTLTTGTPATTPLYVHTGDGTGATLSITSAIAGAGMDFVKAGLADMVFSNGAGVADNTYTGTTYANGGLLTLNRQDTTTSANKISIPGNLVINNGARVGVSRGGQFAASTAVTINEGGLLSLGSGGLTTTGVITLNGGRIQEGNQSLTLNAPGTGLVFNGGYIVSATGFPTDNFLNSDVEYQSSATTPAVWTQNQGIRSGAAQNWNLSLGSGTRTFTIADSATLAAGIPEMTLGARITTGGKLVKAGGGVLRLLGSAANDGVVHSGANTYSGGTDVNGGTLIAGFEAARPAVSGNAVVSGSMMVFDKPINVVVGQKLTGFDNFVVSVISPTQILAASSGGGSGLTSSNTRAAYSFDATVARNGGLGSGAVAVNSTGTLQLDPGSSIAGPVAISTGGTLAGAGTVAGTVSVSGKLSPGVVGGLTTGTITLGSPLTFGSGSMLAVDLGTNSDLVTFSSLANSLVGSGFATLQVTPGAGFSYGNTYTILSNVTTAGFTFATITGYDTGGYTAAIAKSGNNYVLSFTPSSGGNYASWANANGIPGQAALDDFDQDGLSNLVEYSLGSSPTISSLPAGTFAGGTLTFTKGADARVNGDVDYVIETSTNLTTWAPQVTQNAPDASTSISYTLPVGQPKVFGRLKVTQKP